MRDMLHLVDLCALGGIQQYEAGIANLFAGESISFPIPCLPEKVGSEVEDPGGRHSNVAIEVASHQVKEPGAGVLDHVAV